METQSRLRCYNELTEKTEHVKESSDETENIPTIFSAEIKL